MFPGPPRLGPFILFALVWHLVRRGWVVRVWCGGPGGPPVSSWSGSGPPLRATQQSSRPDRPSNAIFSVDVFSFFDCDGLTKYCSHICLVAAADQTCCHNFAVRGARCAARDHVAIWKNLCASFLVQLWLHIYQIYTLWFSCFVPCPPPLSVSLSVATFLVNVAAWSTVRRRLHASW